MRQGKWIAGIMVAATVAMWPELGHAHSNA